jgi:hypothetical protein
MKYLDDMKRLSSQKKIETLKDIMPQMNGVNPFYKLLALSIGLQTLFGILTFLVFKSRLPSVSWHVVPVYVIGVVCGLYIYKWTPIIPQDYEP